jgi:hypothetical protein
LGGQSSEWQKRERKIDDKESKEIIITMQRRRVASRMRLRASFSRSFVVGNEKKIEQKRNTAKVQQ